MTILLVQSSQLDDPTALAATLLTRLATLWFGVLLGIVLLAIARTRIANSAAAVRAQRS
jgi:uncharacterized membrane protein YbhN (UPF0104 family)